ncbi:FIST signal transduction protein [Methanopyrus sp.]
MFTPFKAGVGMSKSGPEEALEEAAEDLDRIDVVLCAFSPRHDPHEVREALVEYLNGDCLILGLSSAGNITTDGFSDGSVAILAMELSKFMAFGMAIGTGLSKNPYRVARETVARAVGSVKVDVSASLAPVATGLVTGNMAVVRHSLVDVLLFADGLCCFNNPEASMGVLNGVLDCLGTVPRVIGGMTADECEFKHTYVFDNSDVYEDALAVLVLYSSVKRGHAVDHGFVPLSDPMIIEIEGVDVIKMNGEPALDVYVDIVGEKPEMETLLKHPLGIIDPGPRPYYLVRTPIDADMERKAMKLVSPLPNGVAARIMEPGDVEGSFKMAVQRALEDAGSPKELGVVFVFNCAARHLIVDTDDAVRLLRDLIGEDVTIFGFNCFGEYGMTPSGKLVQHNQTVATYVLGSEIVSRPESA